MRGNCAGWEEVQRKYHGRGKFAGQKAGTRSLTERSPGSEGADPGHKHLLPISMIAISLELVCIQQSKQRHEICKMHVKIISNTNNRGKGTWGGKTTHHPQTSCSVGLSYLVPCWPIWEQGAMYEGPKT